MKNTKTRITRVLVIFTLLAVVLSAVLIPSSASTAGSDPILSGSEYGVTYNDGVYTISIDAERLAEILTSKSFDKDTLLSIMPEKVYDLIVNRDAASATALLKDLIDTAQFGQLKEDLPIDYITSQLTADELIKIVYVDKIIDLLDIKAIIASLDASEIEGIFREGELDKLFQSLDLSGVITEEKIKFLLDEVNNPDALTTAEITAALKEGAIDRLIYDKAINLEALMTKDIIEKLFDEEDILTDAELEAMLNDPTIIQKIIDDDEVLNEILHNPVFLQDLAAHPEVIDDLVSDQVIVEIFIENDLLDTIVASSTIPAAKLKEIVFENDIDVADLITPEVIANLDTAVINSIISTDDIVKLAGCLTDAELEELLNKNSDAIDTSNVDFNDIYPAYIDAADIEASGVIDDADIAILTAAPYLSDAEKEALYDLGYTDPALVDFSVLFPTYITVNEVLDANVISDTERETLAGLLSSDEKIELAVEKNYIDKTKFNYSDLAEYISFEELEANGIVTDTELESLDAQVFIDAGLTATDVFNSLGTEKAAEIAIEIYKDGRIENPDGTIGNKYLHLEGIDFEEVVDAIDETERAAIVTEIKTVDKIRDHIIDMIHDDFSILAHALNYPKLYKDGIITDDMILDVISSEDVTKILDRKIVTPIQVVDNIKDINDLTDEIVITALPIDKLLKAFDIEELVDEVMKQDLIGLIKALNFKKLLSLEAVKTELKGLKLADLKAIVNFEAAKETLLAKAFKFINTDLKAVTLNGQVVQTSYTGFDVAAIEYALIDAIPTFDKLAVMDDSGLAASFILMYKIEDTIYTNGFQIVFTGDTAALKDYAAKMTEYVSFKLNADRSIDTSISAPAKLAELYVSAVDGTKLSEEIRVKLAEIANVEFNKSDIGSVADAVIEKLTVEELRAVLEAVDLKNIDDKLLEQLNIRESQAQIILDYAAKAVNKMADVVATYPDIDTTLSSFYDKTLADFYEGNGVFNFSFDISVDVLAALENIKDIPEDIEMFFTNTTIDHKVNATVELRNLYSVEFVKDGEVYYTAFRTPETPIANITKASAFAGMGVHGWDMKASDGTVTNDVTATVADDVQLTERFEAVFSAYDSKDALISEQTLYFSEFTHKLEDLTADKFAPVMDEIEHYTFAWDNYTVTEYADFAVSGKYTPVTYTVTFKADGNVVDEIEYTIENYADVVAPAVPAKDHYTGAWETYDLSLGGNFEVNAVYTANTYSIIFKADGKEIATQYYTIEQPSVTEPAVPYKSGYRGYWPAYNLEYTVGQIVEAVYVPAESPLFTYYITFVDEAGNVYGRLEFNRTTPVDSLKAPEALPVKEGYKAYWPEFKHLVMNDELYITTGTFSFTVTVEYEIIKYSVIFKADGVQVGETQYYTIEDKTITVPEVPAKEGYTGVWAEYNLDELGDKVIEAIYTKVDEPPVELDKYYITFVDYKGTVIEKIEFTIETDPSTIKNPAAPERAGYNVSWPSYKLFDEKRFEETGTYSFTVEAVYEAIPYTATFMADGKVVAEITFTVETKSLNEPAIPEKAGYTAVWSSYTLGTEDITIDAIYSTISYKVTFMADGEEVAVRYYTVENKNIDEPEVPAKEGYTGVWAEYDLNELGDKTVEAIYTPVEEDSGSSFWWIILLILIVAAIVIVVIYIIKTKKKGAAQA